MSGLQAGERSYPLDQAAHRALATISELGLTAELSERGGDPTVWQCQLRAAGRPVPWGYGAGKGSPAGAKLGALYEALEHHVCQGRRSGDIELRTCAEIAQSALSAEAYTAALVTQPDASIACRMYSQLDGTGTLAVPVFLSDVSWVADSTAPLRAAVGDTTDYWSLLRYSSNNGSAIGGSFTEAAVHAVNEAIERDAVSLFLINTYLAASPAPVRYYAIASLPPDLRSVHAAAQLRIGRPIWLIDVTTDLGVPSTIAYAPGLNADFWWGRGTSLSCRHSVYRALAELLEWALTASSEKLDHRRAGIARLQAHPRLQACSAVALDGPARPSIGVEFADTPAPDTPAEHLEVLVETLGIEGFTIYANTAREFSNGITAVHVHIPDLEHFHLIADGPAAVVPGRRGRQAALSAPGAVA